MAADDEEGDARREWKFPGAIPGDADDREGEVERWVVVRRDVPVAELSQIAARLEGEGIAVEFRAAADEAGAAQPTRAEMLVHEEDLARALEVFAGRADDVDEDEAHEDAAQREAYLLQNWLCPKCEQASLAVLPRSARWHHALMIWIGFILVSIAYVIVERVTSASSRDGVRSGISDGWQCAWFAAVVISGGLLLSADRQTRCSKCGWRSNA